MKRYLVLPLVLVLAATAYALLIWYDNLFPYGRMRETPAIRPHERPISYMAPGTVPFGGGEAIYRQMDGRDITSPITPGDLPAAVSHGAQLYVHFCIQCHGKNFDGNATVGQSFAPLPTDLRSAKVQGLPDGVMFKEISYGVPKGRQPALDTTIAIPDRWRIIAYVKSLGVRP
jgi:mono/diheme cytochrome c family protein